MIRVPKRGKGRQKSRVREKDTMPKARPETPGIASFEDGGSRLHARNASSV